MIVTTEEQKQQLQWLGAQARKIRNTLIADVRPGENGERLNARAERMMRKAGVNPAPPTVGFPAATCISINDTAAHGIPNSTPFQEGDLVNIDISLEKDGYWVDTGQSTIAGTGNHSTQNAILAVEICLGGMIHKATPGTKIATLTQHCQDTAKKYNMYPIQGIGGHGTGDKLHGPPHIPNETSEPPPNHTLQQGEVIAIEPILTYEYGKLASTAPKDGWALKTAHGLPATQKEHTIIVNNPPLIIT